MTEYVERCEHCEGFGELAEYKGEQYTMDEIFPITVKQVVCPVCKGAGEVLVEHEDNENIA